MFNCVARLGWLNRMTQFKEKAGKDRENASIGLYDYPVLMASDILVYRATHVPVGEDQKQHLELTPRHRAEIQQRLRRIDPRATAFGEAYFPLTEPIIQGPATRVMSLRDGTKKMSKSDASDNSRINLTDDADTIAQKIRRAKTDPEPLPSEEAGLEPRPEADNLVGIFAALADRPKAEVLKDFGGGAVLDLQDRAGRFVGRQARADRRRDEAADAGSGLHRRRARRRRRPRRGDRGRDHERRQGYRRLRPALSVGVMPISSIGRACRRRRCHAQHDRCDGKGRKAWGEPMSLKRRSYEAGHKPKYLVVIDESPECDRAVYYASRRAARTGASVVMLLVIEPHDRHQQWLGVADIMKAEAHEAADQKLDEFAARANGVAGITPERVIRDGDTSEQILKLIDEDEDIATLVLAAGTGKDGPGPLVAGLGKAAGDYPIPVAIVPGHLGDEDLDALS